MSQPSRVGKKLKQVHFSRVLRYSEWRRYNKPKESLNLNAACVRARRYVSSSMPPNLHVAAQARSQTRLVDSATTELGRAPALPNRVCTRCPLPVGPP